MQSWQLIAVPAEKGSSAPAGGTDGAETGGFPPMMMIMLAVLVLFMFLPMLTQKKEKRRVARMKDLKKHDKIVTSGGIFATVVSLDEVSVTIEVGKEMRMKIKRSSIYDLENGAELDAAAKGSKGAKAKPAAAKA
jgi:preprotein translocase subunit YajC